MSTAVAKRPTHLSAETLPVYDWLKANGVDEWLPENPTIVVDRQARTITYTAFVWDGPRGWDAMNFRVTVDGDSPTETRTVPLRVEPGAKVVRVLENLYGGR